MLRKIVLYAISVLFMGLGLLRIWELLLPLIDPTLPRYFELSSILSGVFFSLVGWGLFKRKESGREFAFWLLFLSLIGIVLVFGLILSPDSDFVIHIKLFERPLFDSESNYPLSMIFMFLLVVINTLILIFLEQKETKKLFLSATNNGITAKVSTEAQ